MARPNSVFLQWIHDRLVEVHGENENFDYMHRLRNMICEYEQQENKMEMKEIEDLKLAIRKLRKVESSAIDIYLKTRDKKQVKICDKLAEAILHAEGVIEYLQKN